MRRKLAPLLVGLVALAVTACEETTTTETPKASKSSGIELVKVPAEAVSAGSVFDDEDQKSYEVPGWTYDELRQWYAEEMPDGQDWQKWKWCDLGGGPAVGEALIYSQKPRRILTVALVKDSTPGVVIGTDNSGPC